MAEAGHSGNGGRRRGEAGGSRDGARSGGISRQARTAGIAIALTALAAAVFSVTTILSGPAVFDEEDPEITVYAGDGFSLKLADNPDAGYRWILDSPRPDPAILKASGSRYRAAEPAAEGSGGMRYLDFRAVGAGRTDIRLLHCFRCGTPQADLQDARALTFRVTVQ